MRKQEEIEQQIRGLRKAKNFTPPVSLSGIQNHKRIDAQIEVLESRGFTPKLLKKFHEEKLDDLMPAANVAKAWLDGINKDDLFDKH